METLHFNRDEFHKCYDLLKTGICIVKADVQETVLFANQGLISMYDCKTEEEFLSFTAGRLSGMYTGDHIVLSEKTGAFCFSFFSAMHHMHTADVKAEPLMVDEQACWVLEVVNRQWQEKDSAEDSLTGFPGTSIFYHQALEIVRKRIAEGTFEELCPVCFNIANFRGFNREFGINGGNQCIAYLGTILHQTFPEGLFTRTDADNFLGLVARENIGERLDRACSAMNLYLGRRSYALKAGIVKFDHPADEELVKHSFDMAQIACSSVKNDAMHSYAVFSRQMEEQLEMRQYILDHMDQALEEGYLKIYYQPVVHVLSGKICSFEALARWEDPEKGMISPGVFVPVLESARRIGRLDQYMIERVVQYLHAMLESGRRPVPISLNLSQLDFDLIQPLKCLNEMTERYHTPHSYVHIEITETVLAENQDRMARMIDQFHAEGYEVWLDDFGSGYSSLKSLSHFPFDLIKLDMGFFQNFDAQSRKIVNSIVRMAKELGMHTLAEGVESREQADFLKEIGCERIQGYYYGRPMPGQTVLEQVSQKHLQLESGLEISVYSKAGLIDLSSEDSAYLFLVEHQTIQLLAYNASLQKEVASAGDWGDLNLNCLMSEEITPRHRHMVRFLSGIFDQSSGTEMFIENGSVFRMQASFVAGVREFWIGKAHLTNLSYEERSVLQKDDQTRYAMLLFDGIYHLNLEKDQIEVAACVHSQVKLGTVYQNIRASFLYYCRTLVHREDQKRFMTFIDTEHLRKEAANAECGYVQDFFRILRDDGNYRWTLFIGMPVKHEDHESILLYERNAVFNDYPDLKRLLRDIASSLEPGMFSWNKQEGTAEIKTGLLNAVEKNSKAALFCKDLQGRYLEVNDELLSYFGRKTKEEVIGSTLQELGILVDEEEFRQMEKRVLEHGETIHYHLTLAVSGVCQMLPITVFPWYQGNRIAGTAGYVHSWEKAKEDSFTKDGMTGLLNAYGSLLAANAYDAAFRNSGQEYEAIYLSLHDALRISRAYGEEFFDKAVRMAADLIRNAHLPDGTSAAHLPGFRFLLLGPQAHGQKLLDAAEKVRNGMQEIDEIDGVGCHFSLDLSIAYGSETSGPAALMTLLENRIEKQNRTFRSIREADEQRRSLNLSPELLETSPQRIVIVDTESLDLLFVNKAMRRDLHLPEDYSYEGKKCYQVLQGRDTPCEFCRNSTLPSDRFVTKSEKFISSGNTYDTRNVILPWRGRMVRLYICTPAADHASTAQLNNLLNDELWANESITAGMAEKDPGTGINKTVSQIGWNLQSDRLLVFEERDERTVQCTYEWCVPGQMPVKDELQSVLRSRLEPLYQQFQDNKVLIIANYPAYCRKHPGFWLPLEGIRNVISGHLAIAGQSLGFTLVLNVSENELHRAGYVLHTLTDFIAVMIQNRNNLAGALELSEKDPMTGVGNRAGLQAYLNARTSEETIALIAGDANGLKEVNDTKGHLAGDEMICRIAEILVKYADRDHVFRMGGDEFLVIREGMDEAGARHLIQTIREACESMGLSISLGYAVHHGNLDDIDDLLKKADQSMYEDKGRHYHRRASDQSEEQQ